MQALPAGFRDGIRHFNAGRYFEAHEAFEEALDDVEQDDRWELGLALIQVAVGYHKCAHGHPGGARMLGLGAEKLAPFAADAWDVDVGALRDRVAADLERLAAGGDVFATPPRISGTRGSRSGRTGRSTS